MAMKTTKKCVVCGVTVSPKAKYCDAHVPDKGSLRRRKLRRVAQGMEAAATERNPSYAVHRLAIALGETSDVAEAARIAGIAATAAELEALAARARADHEGLIRARPEAIAELGWRALARLMLRTCERADHISDGQLGSTTKQIADVVDAILGGSTPVYGELHLIVPDLVEVPAEAVPSTEPAVS
jgi:hypothetical protein